MEKGEPEFIEREKEVHQILLILIDIGVQGVRIYLYSLMFVYMELHVKQEKTKVRPKIDEKMIKK